MPAAKYPALSHLSMSNAGITTLNENSFKNADNLKIIRLNRNKIIAFLFTKTPTLEHLMLTNNEIKFIGNYCILMK